MKYFCVNLIKHAHYLYVEKYTVLTKEIRGINKWRAYVSLIEKLKIVNVLILLQLISRL